MPRDLLGQALVQLGRFQLTYPWVFVVAVLVSLLPTALGASRLELRTSFSEFLPRTSPSVLELERVRSRTAGTSTLTIAAEGDDPAALERFVDSLVPRLETLGPRYVASVDAGPRDLIEFLRRYVWLFANLQDLRKLHARIQSKYDEVVARRAGYGLDLDDMTHPPSLSAELDEVERRLDGALRAIEETLPGDEGYYFTPDHGLIAIVVRTPFGSGDPRAFEMIDRIRGLAADALSEVAALSIRVRFTGNIVTSAEEHRTVTRDLTHVGAWGIGLVLAIVFLFFRRVRVLIIMAITIGVGCVWTFGLAELTVGYLNSASGFLISIIAGNGINFGILYMARYLEARRGGCDIQETILLCNEQTPRATLAAAAAAMIAYGSLAATDFLGFRHFGIIGGAGMVVCWVATTLLLPPVLVISEHLWPLERSYGPWADRGPNTFSAPFVWIVRNASRPVAILGAVLGVAAGLLSLLYFVHDPMDYDLTHIRNDDEPGSSRALGRRVAYAVGSLSRDGRAIVTDRRDQVVPLVLELERRRDAAVEAAKPFERVVSIQSLLPEDQAEKVKLAAGVYDLAQKAHAREAVSDKDFARMEALLKPSLTPLRIETIPTSVAYPFEEVDGTRGRLVFIVPTKGESLNDARYLMRWADSFRTVPLGNGEVIRGSGDPVIFADMLLSVRRDAPKVMAVSVVGTLLVILIAFRLRRSGWMALGATLLGVLWLVGCLSLLGIKLNFLSFVAVPISVGVGADYAVNLMKRWEVEGRRDTVRVLTQTGGAVVVCSMTTMLGYCALLMSSNGAVRSFGLAAALGEVTALLASMLVMAGSLVGDRPGVRSSATQEVVL